MNTKDLNELKEMTGLVSEEDIKPSEITISTATNDADIHADTAMVGQYVVANIKGKSCYGMIDGIHYLFNGSRYGFVMANEEVRRECLISPNNVTIAEGAARNMAIKSANKYFNDEITSLNFHLKFLETADMSEATRRDYAHHAKAKLSYCLRWRNALRK